MICPNCGSTMVVGTPIDSFYCKKCNKYMMSNLEELIGKNEPEVLITLGQIANYIENNKKYTLVYTNQVDYHDEQTTLLIDEDKKIVSTFCTDGYYGIGANEIKGILNFLGIKYFERVYNKIPENYFKEYKKYDWRSGNEIL